MNTLNRGFVYFICLVSAMGGLLFGYDWVVIGGAKPFYELFFGIADDPAMQGWAMSSAILGCLIGAVSAGMMADRFGRKPLLIISAFIFLASAIATGAFNDFSLFIVARLVGGVAIGIASALSPMYIAEVAPAQIRGKLVTLNQMTIVFGILAAQIVNMLLAEPIPDGMSQAAMLESWNVLMGWRWMFWAAAVPAAIFFAMTFFIPESPRWLTMVGRIEQAEIVFFRIGGKQYSRDAIAAVRNAEANTENAGLRTLLSRPYRLVLVLGIIIAVFQQWSGTNVIFNYAQEIFAAAGYPLGAMLFNIVVTGVANVVFTFVALFTVEKLGRRKLMLLGAGGLAGIYLILGTCYWLHLSGVLMMVCVVAAIACYAMSLGPITWVLLAELFPNRVRAIAMAVCTFALWTGCFTLTYTFPLLNSWLGSFGTFWTYAGICLAGFLYFARVLPETKGKSLEQLEQELIRPEANKRKRDKALCADKRYAR
ncbi:MAG: sugar porter family MFS transporter [Bacteroidales bacterium]|nr:sugar porter family MFS transporter [Bacteroidales bacterium]